MKQQLKIVVADDHPIVSLGLSFVIKQFPEARFEGAVTSAKELFALIPRVLPNVLFLDLHIPGSDFEDNIQKIRKDYPWLKIIIYSSYYAPDLLKKLINLGVSGFLPKSANRDDILEALEATQNNEVYVGSHRKSDDLAIKKGSESKFSRERLEFQKRLNLSKREKEILQHICQGSTSQIIADELFISKYTVETHRKNILRKLDFNSSAELVKFAVQQGLV